jgi:putative ABC transport system permease protein
MKFFPVIWCGLKRKKARTILTLMSIVVAFLLYGYLSAVNTAFNMGVTVAGADRVVIRHKVSIIQLLPASYQARIERVNGVAKAAHMTWFGGIYQKPSNFFPQMPVVPADFFEVWPEFLLPEAQKQAWLRTRTGAIVGRRTAEKYGFKIGDRIPIQATIWRQKGGQTTWEFDLVGIYDGAEKNTDTTQLFFRYDYFDEARVQAKGSVGWYGARIQDPNQSALIAQAIDQEFANSPEETKTESEGAFVQGFAKQVGDVGAILAAILTAVFFTILLVVGNTMAQAVRERTEEIGVLKALGFTNTLVLWLVLAEALMLSFSGGIIGMGISWLLISRGDPTGGSLPNFFLPSHAFVSGFILMLALGAATGFLPAWRAMKLTVAEALRRG